MLQAGVSEQVQPNNKLAEFWKRAWSCSCCSFVTEFSAHSSTFFNCLSCLTSADISCWTLDFPSLSHQALHVM